MLTHSRLDVAAPHLDKVVILVDDDGCGGVVKGWSLPAPLPLTEVSGTPIVRLIVNYIKRGSVVNSIKRVSVVSL